jgi:acyl-coenzyme A thioesterase PaaI-like protein
MTRSEAERVEEEEPHTTDARLSLAASLRSLGNALVDHQPADDLLERIGAAVDELVPLVEGTPERPHAFHGDGANLFTAPVPEGVPVKARNAFPDCVVSGMANPMGIAAKLWREGEEAVCHVTLGAAFEGAPGRAHGGIVAALIDETMGLVLSILATTAYTGRLSITYRAPTPVGEPLEVRARKQELSGRKLTITAEMRCGDRLLAEAEGLFITVDPARFLAGEG